MWHMLDRHNTKGENVMSDDKPKIVDFNKKDESRAALEQIKRDLEVILEMTSINAKIQYEKYDALVKAGFSPEQALDLVR